MSVSSHEDKELKMQSAGYLKCVLMTALYREGDFPFMRVGLAMPNNPAKACFNSNITFFNLIAGS